VIAVQGRKMGGAESKWVGLRAREKDGWAESKRGRWVGRRMGGAEKGKMGGAENERKMRAREKDGWG
jgi:hypothetical protein